MNDVEEQLACKQLEKNLASREWRLNNLYYIIGKDPVTEKSRKMKFKLNWAQRALIKNLWFFSIILKARQLGFTTFVCILFLDTCLFKPNTRCGIIAHTREDAEEFFENKIRYAYTNLPKVLTQRLSAPSNSKKKLVFTNGSNIRVGVSLRSGTFDMLHISEFGKICATMPAKAREIVTGSINTVHAGSFIFIESTAEGRDGYFFKWCEEAKNRLLSGIKPNKLQFKFFFFPWWKEPSYNLPTPVPISREMKEYFADLETKGIRLTDKQKWWYVTKYESQEDDMMREFPSTPEEAFNASIRGAYFSRQMTRLRKLKRITSVPHDPMYPVDVFWDIGYRDNMSLWFHQYVGTSHRLIRYEEGSGEGLEYYVELLNKLTYVYGRHYMPHDSANHSPQTGKTFEEYARGLGLRNIVMVERPLNTEAKLEQIQATRLFLAKCYIDEENCEQGIKGIDNYRKEWDANLGDFKRTPLHNWSSNCADSLRTGAVGYKPDIEVNPEDLVPELGS